jgi:hypothetical protein
MIEETVFSGSRIIHLKGIQSRQQIASVNNHEVVKQYSVKQSCMHASSCFPFACLGWLQKTSMHRSASSIGDRHTTGVILVLPAL